MDTVIDDAARQDMLEHYFDHVIADPVRSHDIYHDDAVLEFPQSGERFEGVENFREWRSEYPGDVELRCRRVVGRGDVWVVEVSLRYDGGPWKPGVAVMEFRGDRVARERVYSMEPWEAPEWRARWRSATPAV